MWWQGVAFGAGGCDVWCLFMSSLVLHLPWSLTKWMKYVKCRCKRQDVLLVTKLTQLFASPAMRCSFEYLSTNAGLTWGRLWYIDSVIYRRNRYTPLAKCEGSNIRRCFFLCDSSCLVYNRNIIIWQLFKCINSKRNKRCKTKKKSFFLRTLQAMPYMSNVKHKDIVEQ